MLIALALALQISAPQGAELLAPGLLGFEEMRLRVDLDAGDQRGHTRQSSDGIPVRVAMDVDVEQMRALLKRVFP